MPDLFATRNAFRRNRALRFHAGVVALLICTPMLTGCIVGQMRDDLAATRAGVERLAELTPALRQTNESLERSNAQMERMYAELAGTHKSLVLVLERVGSTNTHLQEATNHLRHLDPMLASLKGLDESLAALRKIVENIDKAVPLINLTAGTPPAPTAAPGTASPEERR